VTEFLAVSHVPSRDRQAPIEGAATGRRASRRALDGGAVYDPTEKGSIQVDARTDRPMDSLKSRIVSFSRNGGLSYTKIIFSRPPRDAKQVETRGTGFEDIPTWV
jgi:hypothetical protein